MRLLLVEDDGLLADAVARGLRREGYAVDLAADGASAIEMLGVVDYELVVLDRNLPGVHGDEVCEQLAREGARARILMLTASGEVDQRVEGLLLGADDYLAKPFAMTELVARLRALARRVPRALPIVLRWGDVWLDPARRTAGRGERAVGLTNRELAVLETLLMAEMLVTREDVTLAIAENPELFFEPGGLRSPGGPSIEEASENVQRRAMDRAAARSRRWTATAFLAVLAGALVSAWLLTGRILRPIRLVTDQARAAAQDDLSGRVALEGPNDEIRELADTFDVMLDRIAHSFEVQRRFSAQVSHELRTPLALMRTEIDMLVDDLDEPHLRDRLGRVAEATERADRLVAQLSVLARVQAGDLTREVFGLDEMVGNVVGRAMEAPALRDVRVELDLEVTTIAGDRALLESLVRNLVHNAGRHNRPEGWVAVVARPAPNGDGAELVVANSVAGGGEPHQGPPGAPHIGLTIVAAAIEAHDGSIGWRCEAGSVTAVVRLPTPVGEGGSR